MKRLFLLFSFISLNCSVLLADDVSAFRGLVNRLLPQYADRIEGRMMKNVSSVEDMFTLSSEEDKIVITANSANSMAVGLNHYLKYYCKTTVSWFADDAFAVPTTLPVVPKPVTVKSRVKHRFFLNYCTFGYTMPWWDWKEWEHFIDWMALNGINLPLAITGQESIWYKVWKQLGLDDETIRRYFTGPAHLPWHRMINVDRWGGPLPMSWLSDQEVLQKKIVARERELNMRPVLPAFSGHVPMDIKKVYPEAKITQIEPWDGFAGDYAPCFLDPMDPIFKKIQKAFLEQQQKAYGTDHIYGIDLFNEITPPSYEPDYLARVSRQIYSTLKAVDRHAVWLQMGWMFYYNRKNWTDERMAAYLNANPADRQLILDYFCEKREVWRDTKTFFNTPYIWCYLGNFGGNTFLTGNLHDINNRLEHTFAEGGKHFKGIGSTLEGFDCNPYVYEYVFEKAWDFDLHHDVKAWTHGIADSRTGMTNEDAYAAYDELINEVYNSNSTSWHAGRLNQRPSIDRVKKGKKAAELTYESKHLHSVAERLLAVNSKTSSYVFDVVNVVRQWLSNKFDEEIKSYVAELEGACRYKVLQEKALLMMEMIDDIDRLVSTEQAFLLGKWIGNARNKGVSAEEADYYEENARNLLTTWGDKGSVLNDYANRTWSGLTKYYYGVRWQMFFNAVNEALLAGETFDKEHQDRYEKHIKEFEYRWWKERVGVFNSEPVGDGIAISRELLKKYGK